MVDRPNVPSDVAAAAAARMGRVFPEAQAPARFVQPGQDSRVGFGSRGPFVNPTPPERRSITPVIRQVPSDGTPPALDAMATASAGARGDPKPPARRTVGGATAATEPDALQRGAAHPIPGARAAARREEPVRQRERSKDESAAAGNGNGGQEETDAIQRALSGEEPMEKKRASEVAAAKAEAVYGSRRTGRQNRGKILYTHMLTDMLSGALLPGAQLHHETIVARYPTPQSEGEPELSRRTVSRVVAQFRNEGLVHTTQGVGITVGARPEQAPKPPPMTPEEQAAHTAAVKERVLAALGEAELPQTARDTDRELVTVRSWLREGLASGELDIHQQIVPERLRVQLHLRRRQLADALDVLAEEGVISQNEAGTFIGERSAKIPKITRGNTKERKDAMQEVLDRRASGEYEAGGIFDVADTARRYGLSKRTIYRLVDDIKKLGLAEQTFDERGRKVIKFL